jgi:hypothetical protein
MDRYAQYFTFPHLVQLDSSATDSGQSSVNLTLTKWVQVHFLTVFFYQSSHTIIIFIYMFISFFWGGNSVTRYTYSYMDFVTVVHSQ